MRKTRLQQMQEQIINQFGSLGGQHIARLIEKEYQKLCNAYADSPKALYRHIHNNIFPVSSTFHALMDQGMDRSQAAELAQQLFLKLMEQPANFIRKAMNIPGLYRLMPRIWKTMMSKLFGEDAGFQFKFYPTDGRRVKFDILECPYLQICRDLDCAELAPVFCTTDDICYGHIHPKLIWNRTQTLARNDVPCDFDLFISK